MELVGGRGGWGGRRFAKWKERESRGRRWWQHENGVGGLSPQTDAGFVKGHFGGVDGREVKGAEHYWDVGEVGGGRGVDGRGRGGKSEGLRMPCVTKESTTRESMEEGVGEGEGQGTASSGRVELPSVCMSMGTWLASPRQASVTWDCPMGKLAAITWDDVLE